MIEIVRTPNTIAGFRAVGEVTREDYTNVVVPAVKELISRTDEINLLLVIDAKAAHFKPGKWIADILLELKRFGKWHRAAIVCDSDKAVAFTERFTTISPGEFRGFKKEAFSGALEWLLTRKPA